MKTARVIYDVSTWISIILLPILSSFFQAKLAEIANSFYKKFSRSLSKFDIVTHKTYRLTVWR